jgi:hypothetical protein
LDIKYILYIIIKSSDYHNINISSIVFSYKEVNDSKNVINNNKNTSSSKVISKNVKKNINKYKLMGYNLPATMDCFATEWGQVHFYNNYSKAIVYKLNSKLEYHINLFSNYQEVDLKIENKVILSFKDFIKDIGNLSTFERIVNNQKNIFEDGKLIYKEILRKVPFLKKINPSIYISKNIITMDLETRVIDNKIEPYCISIYDGKTLSNFFYHRLFG